MPRNGVWEVGEHESRLSGLEGTEKWHSQEDLEEWSVATDRATADPQGSGSLGVAPDLPRLHPGQWGVTRAVGSLLPSSVGFLGSVLGDSVALGL